MGKSETVDFSETIVACDRKVGRCRQLIEIMKVCEYTKVKVISLPYIFQVLYVLCFTRPRYQVSVYRTIGTLVLNYMHNSANLRKKQDIIAYFAMKYVLKCSLKGHYDNAPMQYTANLNDCKKNISR